jgi:cytochrome P450
VTGLPTGPSVEVALQAGLSTGRIWHDAGAGVWRVCAFEAARALLMDRRFAFPAPPPLRSASLPPPVREAARRGREVQTRWFALDSELHMQVRPILAAALSGAAVTKLEPSMRGRAAEMLAVAAPGALRDFATAFPRQIQLDLFGVPAGARSAVVERAMLAAALFPHRRADPVRPWIAQAALETAVAQAFDAAAPPGAVVLAAVQDAVRSGRLDRPDAIAALSVVMIAALETAGRGLTALIAKLAADPQIRALAASAEARSALIEEELRDTAGPQVVGCFDFDLVLEGVRIPAGSRLLVDLRLANHDPARFAEPDRFIPDRHDADHIAFGAGVHVCVGRHFARLHLRVGAQAFLEAYPRLARERPQELAILARLAAPAAA